METDALIRDLRRELLLARQRVYRVGHPTPLQAIPHRVDGPELFVKREDLSPIHAYKWRGAYNRMACLDAAELQRGVVTASAGNHAQGVALAAAQLGTHAVIFMPLSTPRMKQAAVRRHGGSAVEIRLTGDTYDAAGKAAHAFAEESGGCFIHAYNDLRVIAGQGTLADEVAMSGVGPFDVAYLQVGGGGMAAGAAAWLKLNFPDIHIVGVEGVGQASMQAAIAAGAPVELASVDVFCDGTAVRKVGDTTFQLCRELVDEWVSVTNDEVSAAVQFLWEELRCIPEPSGAMGVAAVLKQWADLSGKRVLSVLCGANMDFEQLALISKRAAVGASKRHFLQIDISESRGSLLELLGLLPEAVNIIDLRYGKTDTETARPVIGFDQSAIESSVLIRSLNDSGYHAVEVTNEEDVEFRLIHFEAGLLKFPAFITVEFHERPGALAELLRVASPSANIAYFNYSTSGERVGRALIGFDFDSDESRRGLTTVLNSARNAYRNYKFVSASALQRIVN